MPRIGKCNRDDNRGFAAQGSPAARAVAHSVRAFPESCAGFLQRRRTDVLDLPTCFREAFTVMHWNYARPVGFSIRQSRYCSGVTEHEREQRRNDKPFDSRPKRRVAPLQYLAVVVLRFFAQTPVGMKRVCPKRAASGFCWPRAKANEGSGFCRPSEQTGPATKDYDGLDSRACVGDGWYARVEPERGFHS